MIPLTADDNALHAVFMLTMKYLVLALIIAWGTLAIIGCLDYSDTGDIGNYWTVRLTTSELVIKIHVDMLQ